MENKQDMNLLNRLKPHFKQELEKWNQTQPELVDKICTVLEEEEYVSNLRYSIIIDLNHLFKSWNAFDYFEKL